MRPYRCVISIPSSEARSSSVGAGGAPPMNNRTGSGQGAALRGSEQHRDHRRRGAEVGDAFGQQRIPDRVGLDRRQADVPCSHRGDRPCVGPPVAVEHRQCPQVDAAGLEPSLGDHAKAVQVSAAVGGHDALRATGRPGGVVDREQRALVGCGSRSSAGSALRRASRNRTPHEPSGSTQTTRGADPRAASAHPRAAPPARWRRTRCARLNGTRMYAYSAPASRVFSGNQDASRAGHRVVELEHRRDVRQQRCHPLTFADRELAAEHARGPAYAVSVFGVAPDAPAVRTAGRSAQTSALRSMKLSGVSGASRDAHRSASSSDHGRASRKRYQRGVRATGGRPSELI